MSNNTDGEKEPSLAELLATGSGEMAKQGVERYYHAESMFYDALTRVMNTLTRSHGREAISIVCGSTFGPSRWKYVFQTACQLTQEDGGDLILCALFACMGQVGRDWTDNDTLHSPEANVTTLHALSKVMGDEWPNIEELLSEYVPDEYRNDLGVVLSRTVYWAGMRWFEHTISQEAIMEHTLEGFHPALTAAANACMDADYMWLCLWNHMEPNSKLAHTVAGRLAIKEMEQGIL